MKRVLRFFCTLPSIISSFLLYFVEEMAEDIVKGTMCVGGNKSVGCR